jgi:hypothetical protein
VSYGAGQLAGLAGNAFLSQAHHTAYAVALRTLHDQYPEMAGVLARTILSCREKVGQTPVMDQAVQALSALSRLVNRGRLLLNDARAALKAGGRGAFAGGSRDPQVSQEDWDLAYTIDLDAMQALLRELEPARYAAQVAADAVIDDTLARLGRQRSSTPAVPPPLDWAGPNVAEDFAGTVRGAVQAVKRGAAAVGAAVGAGIPWVLLGALVTLLAVAKYRRTRA